MTTDWTDANEHDPGVTVLELLVYTAEALLFALTVLRWRSRRRRRRGVVHVSLGAAKHSTPGCGVLDACLGASKHSTG